MCIGFIFFSAGALIVHDYNGSRIGCAILGSGYLSRNEAEAAAQAGLILYVLLGCMDVVVACSLAMCVYVYYSAQASPSPSGASSGAPSEAAPLNRPLVRP